MRAAVYLRISQDRTGEGAGVERQREDCLALAKQLGWQVVEVYQDNDVSASSGKPRPSYRRMLTDIEVGKVDAIIAWHTDRLYRRLADLEELANLCGQRKLAVRTCRAGELDLSTPTGRMIAEILGSVASYEVRQKADRWLRSVRQRREAGKFSPSGPRSFGYNRDGTLNEPEADALRSLARDLLAGTTTISAASRWLTEQGLLTTYGNAWQTASLRRLLTAPRTAGLSKLRDPDTGQDVILGEGEWEPILDRETWEQIRARVARNGVISPGGRRPNALLHGIAVCGQDGCGRNLTKTVSSVPIYQCRTAARTSRHITVSARSLEQMVESYARAKWADERVRNAVVARLTPGEAGKLQQEIADLEAELVEWRDSLLATRRASTKADVVAAMDRIRDELDEKRAQIQPITFDLALITGKEWPEDLERRSRLIRLVVRRVVVMPAAGRGRFDQERVVVEPAQ